MMNIAENSFEEWMEKLSTKLEEIGKDIRTLINTTDVLEDNEKILDNQDLAFLLKVSYRSLQRYRTNGILPFFSIEGRVYYLASDVREFVKKNYVKSNPDTLDKV